MNIFNVQISFCCVDILYKDGRVSQNTHDFTTKRHDEERLTPSGSGHSDHAILDRIGRRTGRGHPCGQCIDGVDISCRRIPRRHLQPGTLLGRPQRALFHVRHLLRVKSHPDCHRQVLRHRSTLLTISTCLPIELSSESSPVSGSWASFSDSSLSWPGTVSSWIGFQFCLVVLNRSAPLALQSTASTSQLAPFQQLSATRLFTL